MSRQCAKAQSAISLALAGVLPGFQVTGSFGPDVMTGRRRRWQKRWQKRLPGLTACMHMSGRELS